MIYWFLASLFLFCFPCTSPLFEYKEDGPKVLADMPACIKNMKIIYIIKITPWQETISGPRKFGMSGKLDEGNSSPSRLSVLWRRTH